MNLLRIQASRVSGIQALAGCLLALAELLPLSIAVPVLPGVEGTASSSSLLSTAQDSATDPYLVPTGLCSPLGRVKLDFREKGNCSGWDLGCGWVNVQGGS